MVLGMYDLFVLVELFYGSMKDERRKTKDERYVHVRAYLYFRHSILYFTFYTWVVARVKYVEVARLHASYI